MNLASIAFLVGLAAGPASNRAPAEPPPITGVVLDAQGEPIEGAILFIDGQHGDGVDLRTWRFWRSRQDLRGQSDDQGRFRIFAGLGRALVMAGLPGDPFRARAVLVDTDHPETLRNVRLQFRGEATIQGRLVDPEGQGVANVAVRAFPEPAAGAPPGGASFGIAQSDHDGGFEIANLLPGAYRLYAEGAGWWCQAASREGFPVKTGIIGLAVPVKRMTLVRGKVLVTDPTGHRAPPDRFAIETPPSGGWGFTSDDGRFEVPIYMPWKGLPVFVRSEGFATRAFKVDLAPGEQRDLGELVLGGPRTVTGRVVDMEGKAVAEATVELGYATYGMPPRTTTDGEGRFTLAGLAAGDVPLRIIHPDHRRTERLVASSVDDLEIRMADSTSVRLRVEDADGSPLKGALVRALGGGFGWCRSDAAGACTLGGLPPGRNVLRLSGGKAREGARPQPWDVHVDIPADRPLAMRLRSPQRRSKLRVNVVGADGKYLQAFVFVVPGRIDAAQVLGPTRVPRLPYYAAGMELLHPIDNLPPDQYTIVASSISLHPGCALAYVDLEEGADRSVTVKVPATAPECWPPASATSPRAIAP